MIPARKGGPVTWLIDRYVDAKVRRAFRVIWIRGQLPEIAEGTLVYANHSCFWDGFIAHQLCRAAKWDGYCLMEERHLERYRFLARLGAFSIRRGDAPSALESFRYASKLLAGPRGIFVFPEGVMANRCGPLRLERGVEVLAALAKVQCLPVAFRYTFFDHELPEVLIQVGEAHPPAPLAVFEARLNALHAALAAAETARGFNSLVRGRRGVSERWGASTAPAEEPW